MASRFLAATASRRMKGAMSVRIYPDCSSAIRLDEPFELLAPLISQVVITTVASGAVVQSQSVC
jgi:hypothetical protein